jgi:hypothetical protein
LSGLESELNRNEKGLSNERLRRTSESSRRDPP